MPHRLMTAGLQAALAPGAATFLSTFLRGLGLSARAGPLLDIGCRFHRLLAEAGLHATGLAIPPIRKPMAGARALASPASLPFADRTFSAVLALGLLNYLPDETARRAIGEMMRVGRREGLVVVFAAIAPDALWRRPIASAVRILDGEHRARSEREVRALFDGHLTWSCQRVTYALTGLEGLWLTSRGMN